MQQAGQGEARHGMARHGRLGTERNERSERLKIVVVIENENQVIKFRNFMAPAGVEPEEVARELAKVADEEGLLKPASVVEAARAETSPLHPCFTWDDSAAAEKQRLHEARLLIKCIRIERTETGRTEPVYVSVRTVEARGYMRASDITTVGEWEGAVNRAREAVARAAACIEDLRRVAKRLGKDADGVVVELLRRLR